MLLEIQEVAATLAAAKEISLHAVVAAFLSELHYHIKKKRTKNGTEGLFGGKDNFALLCFDKSLVKH